MPEVLAAAAQEIEYKTYHCDKVYVGRHHLRDTGTEVYGAWPRSDKKEMVNAVAVPTRLPCPATHQAEKIPLLVPPMPLLLNTWSLQGMAMRPSCY